MKERTRINRDFFDRDVLDVAPDLLGKRIVITGNVSNPSGYTITETEAYRGEDDLACHASKGRTGRTATMYRHGGVLYVYLVYGMHWMLNIVTGSPGEPQAVLIRGVEGISGPGRLTRAMEIDKKHNGLDLCTSPLIWLEDCKTVKTFQTTPRIGIDYAGPVWKSKPWRFVVVDF